MSEKQTTTNIKNPFLEGMSNEEIAHMNNFFANKEKLTMLISQNVVSEILDQHKKNNSKKKYKGKKN
jgi:hypothetical protein